MSDTTARHGLTFIQEGQTGGEKVVNDDLRQLDILLHSSIIDRDLTSPPGGPSVGDMYIPKSTATGDWVGRENQIAYWLNSKWNFINPLKGTQAYVEDETVTVTWSGTSWVSASGGGGNMSTSTYDPRGIGSDSFDQKNHRPSPESTSLSPELVRSGSQINIIDTADDDKTLVTRAVSAAVDSNTVLAVNVAYINPECRPVDTSLNANFIERFATVCSESQEYVRGGSYQFDGTTPRYFRIPYKSIWDFGSNDFMIEVAFRPSSITATTHTLIAHYDNQDSNALSKAFELQVINATTIRLKTSDGVTVTTWDWSVSIVIDTWYHIAVNRNGSDLKCWLNGTANGTTHTISGVVNSPTSVPIVIGLEKGEDSTFDHKVNGFIDAVRVVSGVSVYSTDFTPSTDPFGLARIVIDTEPDRRIKGWSKISDPGVSDDSSAGYSVNDIWTNTTSDDSWVCQDSTDGAAIWAAVDSAGTTDHGSLTGLADDDHTQYHNDARGDARYPRRVVHATLPPDENDDTYEVGTLWIEGDAKRPFICVYKAAGAAEWLKLWDHGSFEGLADDDHTQYHNDARGDARYARRVVHATLPPDENDDTYEVGTLWIEGAFKRPYICVYKAAGAAEWMELWDHGSFEGLTDDDHTQYHTDARGDVRYPRKIVASRSPDADDDYPTYGIGTIWTNNQTDESFICVNNTATAAIWTSITASATGGVTDHGALTGLADDDHTQYHNDARGDVRYPRKNSTTTNPAASDDGYDIGSVWVNTTNDSAFICVDNTATAAIWTRFRFSSPVLDFYSAPGTPTTAQDSTEGYSIGHLWYSTMSKDLYLCTSTIEDEAEWVNLNEYYNTAEMSQATAEAGTSGTIQRVSALRIKQAITALALQSSDIDTLAKLNTIVTNATLIDTSDSRLSDARTPTAHASDHTDGTDDIQDATATQKGLATAAQITKLDGIEAGATADQTGAEIKASYEGEADTNAYTDAEKSKVSKLITGDNKLNGTTNPTASDDASNSSGSGTFSVGSLWVDTNNDEAYRCVDASTNNAVWVKTTLDTGELSTVALSGSFSDLIGFVTTSQITNDAVTLAKIQNLDTARILGRVASGTGNAEELTAAQVLNLIGVEIGATADQTGAEIKASYEGEADTNAYTDADHTKLDGIEAGATADQTAAEILAALLTVDGTGTLLDADLLDGQEATSFATAAQGSAADSALQSSDIDTLAELNAIVADATLIDTSDSRLSDARTPTAHASDHTDGTDDIQDATATQKGLATAAQITKLDGIEAGATADQSAAEIEAEYNSQVAAVSEVDARAGTSTVVKRWTPQRVRQSNNGETKVLRCVLPLPLQYYDDAATYFPIWENVDQDITITKVRATCDAAPTIEVTQSLKYADNLIGLANAVVISAVNTASGTKEVTSGWTDNTVSAGKTIYLSFGASPHADIKFISYQIEYTID